MATSNPTDSNKGDGAADTPAPGIPDPNPTVPDASIEPAAQMASTMANPLDDIDTKETPQSVAPPLPADYEMPDDYANEDAVAKVKAWAEAHPGLAIAAAAGIGLVVGRIVTGLVPSPEPPSLADRVEKRAKVLSKEAKKRGKDLQKQTASFTDDAGESLQEALHRASEALQEAAGKAGHAAEDGYEKTKDFAETIADAAKVAVTGVLATKIDDWVKR